MCCFCCCRSLIQVAICYAPLFSTVVVYLYHNLAEVCVGACVGRCGWYVLVLASVSCTVGLAELFPMLRFQEMLAISARNLSLIICMLLSTDNSHEVTLNYG